MEEAIVCCSASTFQDYEIIVVDGGSTDEHTLDVLRQLSRQQMKIVRHTNREPSEARNIGIREAQGKYILPLDAHDRIHPTMLEKSVWILETRPQVGFVYSWLQAFGQEHFVRRGRPFNFYHLLFENIIPSCSLFRKAAWEQAGGYNERIVGGYEDWDFWIRLAGNGWIGYQIPEKLSYYRNGKPNQFCTRITPSIRKQYPDLYLSSNLRMMRKKWIENEGLPPIIHGWHNPSAYRVRPSAPGKKQVLFIMAWMVIGGAEKVMLQILEALPKDEYEVIVVTTLPGEQPWHDLFSRFTDQIFHLPHYFTDSNQMQQMLFHIMQTRDIQMVHINNSKLAYDLLPELKRRFPPTKTVALLHGYVPEASWDYVRYSSQYDPYIDRFVVVKKSLQEVLTCTFGIDSHKVALIPNGVDPDQFQPGDEEETSRIKKWLRIRPDKRIVSFIGRLSHDKDPVKFVSVCASLARKDRADQLRFLMVGEGHLRRRVIAEIRKRGLQKKVKLLGYREDVHEILKVTDVLVSTSPAEGHPLIGLEAMAAGVPIVTFEVSGWRELLQEGRSGIFVSRSPKEESVMARKIAELLNDPILRREIGKQAREFVTEHYTQSRFSQRYRELYRLIAPSETTVIHEHVQPSLDCPCALITVAIPSYNPGPFLSHAVGSIFAQSFTRWRMVIVDDASTDNSLRCIEPYLHDKRVTVIRNERNQGQSRCLNTALAASDTPYFIQLDADDWLEPDTLEALYAEAQALPDEVAVIGGNLQIVDETTGNTFVKKGRPFAGKAEFLFANQSVWPRFYRTSALKSIEGWRVDDPLEGRYVEDLGILYRLIEKYRFHWMDQVFYIHRRHDRNLTNDVAKTGSSFRRNISEVFKRWFPSLEPVFLKHSNGYYSLVCAAPAGMVEKLEKRLLEASVRSSRTKKRKSTQRFTP
ncbi:glycosyltransferase [Cohnella pontilimi]|uniref:Glycosyltransferase n=1 Tax=Cohnella pontilimi TaxID=2564100 RepID=A0A4U0FGW5_9BACL|nr:glycosyltransferase [Cohnella pontilimi]